MKKAFSELLKNMKDLNSKIKEYNDTTDKELYTIEKALDEFLKNSPKF